MSTTQASRRSSGKQCRTKCPPLAEPMLEWGCQRSGDSERFCARIEHRVRRLTLMKFMSSSAVWRTPCFNAVARSTAPWNTRFSRGMSTKWVGHTECSFCDRPTSTNYDTQNWRNNKLYGGNLHTHQQICRSTIWVNHTDCCFCPHFNKWCHPESTKLVWGTIC